MAWATEVIAAHRDDDCCVFTTVGRRTANAHRIEIWFGVSEDAVFLISGNGPGADWFQNALANPAVTVEFGDDMLVGAAGHVMDNFERQRIGHLMGEKYPWAGDPSIGLTRQAWCYEVPLLKITFPEG